MTCDFEGDQMPRPTVRQKLVKTAREQGTFTRVEVPKATCERCDTEVYAMPDGTPRVHLRDSRPGEAMYSPILPTMTECAE
jgi:hypothetical protein